MTPRISSQTKLKVADEVWIATALLHREHPERRDFAVEEIVDRAAKEGLGPGNRPGVYVHVVQHSVANRRPNPGRYRMLYETAPGRRRLFRKGDPYHPAREGSKVTPNPDELPQGYGGLLNWYRDWSSDRARSSSAEDPLLALAKSGAQLWSDENADEYVRRLREGWERAGSFGIPTFSFICLKVERLCSGGFSNCATRCWSAATNF